MFMVVGTFTGQTVFSKEEKGHHGLNVQQEFEFCTIQSKLCTVEDNMLQKTLIMLLDGISLKVE